MFNFLKLKYESEIHLKLNLKLNEHKLCVCSALVTRCFILIAGLILFNLFNQFSLGKYVSVLKLNSRWINSIRAHLARHGQFRRGVSTALRKWTFRFTVGPAAVSASNSLREPTKQQVCACRNAMWWTILSHGNSFVGQVICRNCGFRVCLFSVLFRLLCYSSFVLLLFFPVPFLTLQARSRYDY